MASRPSEARRRVALLALLLACSGLALGQATRGIAGGSSASSTLPAATRAAASPGDAALQQQFQQLKFENQALQQRIATQQGTIDALRQQQRDAGRGSTGGSSTGTAVAVAGAVAAAAIIGTQKHQINALTRQNAELSNRIADLSHQATGLTGQADAQKHQVDALIRQNADLNSRIAVLTGQISALTAQGDLQKRQIEAAAAARGVADKRRLEMDKALRDAHTEASQVSAAARDAAARADAAESSNASLRRQLDQARDESLAGMALAAAAGIALAAAGVRLWWPRVSHVTKPLAVSVLPGDWMLATRSHGAANHAFTVRTQWIAGATRVRPADTPAARPASMETRHQEPA